MRPLDVFSLLIPVGESHEAALLNVGALEVKPVCLSCVLRCLVAYQMVLAFECFGTAIEVAGKRPDVFMDTVYVPLEFIALRKSKVAQFANEVPSGRLAHAIIIKTQF